MLVTERVCCRWCWCCCFCCCCSVFLWCSYFWNFSFRTPNSELHRKSNSNLRVAVQRASSSGNISNSTNEGSSVKSIDCCEHERIQLELKTFESQVAKFKREEYYHDDHGVWTSDGAAGASLSLSLSRLRRRRPQWFGLKHQATSSIKCMKVCRLPSTGRLIGKLGLEVEVEVELISRLEEAGDLFDCVSLTNFT